MEISLLTGLVTTLAATIATAAMSIYKNYLDKRRAEVEDKEVTNDVQKTITNIISIKNEDKIDDVLSLMIKNVAELREYYIINKQQARNSFSAAIFISFLGFCLFSAGVVISYSVNTQSIIQYSTIGGSIVEIIAGLFFWLYNKAMKQINIFHGSLLKTEKFLTGIQLVEKISSENRDKVYTYIIEKVISNNQEKNENLIV